MSDMLAKVWSNFEHSFRTTLQTLTMWWQAAFPISVSPSMAADDYNPVSLRHKSKKKSRTGNGAMSRRRVSVKELGQPDHQGWLYKKKESKGFLGMKWKKFWFVLKKTALYWYTNQLAEKAEGYIDLTNFMIDRAIECKKKHAFKACHPQVMMFYFAAENHEEMNIWLNKLGLASIHYEPTEQDTAAECYSEASDHEDTETTDIPPPPYCEQTQRDSGAPSGPPGSTHQGTLPPPYTPTVPSEGNGSHSSPPSEAPAVCSVQVHLHQHPPEEDEEVEENSAPLELAETGFTEEGAANMEASGVVDKGDYGNTADEMEKLYIHLKEASLSPIGDRKPSTKREFRASFVKRCKNQTVNDKLHLVRTLNSTLKSKQADLQALEEVLSDTELTSVKFREWKEANGPLAQEICVPNDQHVESEASQDGAMAIAAPVAESSF